MTINCCQIARQMNIYDLLFHFYKHLFLQPNPYCSTDKIAGFYSTAIFVILILHAISFIIGYSFNPIAKWVTIYKYHSTYTETTITPTSVLANNVAKFQLIPIQNNWIISFLYNKFFVKTI